MNKTFANSTLVFIAGSTYGFIVPVIKIANENGIFPSSFIPMQYLVSFVVCFAILLVKRDRYKRAGDLPKLALLGLFTGSTSICYYTAVTLLPSAIALTLLFQYIWINILFECIDERRLPHRSSVVAVIIVLVGTMLSTGLFDENFRSLNVVGIVFGAGSALFYALFLFFSGKIATDEPTTVRTTMLALGGLIVTTIIAPQTWVTSAFDPECWPYAITLAFMGIIIPATIINYASPKISSGMVSIMASSELPVGIMAAWAFTGDTPTPLALVGCALILAGIVYKQLPRGHH